MALREFGSWVINLRVSASEMISPSSISGPVYPKTKQWGKNGRFYILSQKVDVAKVT